MAGVRLTARVLGGFDLRVDDRPVTATSFERPSGLRFLKLLLTTPGHRVRREEAAELLWPDAEPERSSANLRKAVHFARRALAAAEPSAEQILEGEGDALRLDAAALEVDADELQAAISEIHAAADASPAAALDTLIRLGGLELLPGDPYEEWLVPIRERLRHASVEALIAGAGISRRARDRARGFALVERALALEPADERAHRVGIELHLDAGALHAARRQLQAARQAVAEAYGVEVDSALEQLIAEHAATRAGAVAEAVEPPIVGRRRELSEAESALDAATAGRSSGIVLRGPAGIGKSRILRDLAGSARASGATVLEIRGLEGAAPAPFAGVGSAIVHALGEGAIATLPEPGRSALLATTPEARVGAGAAVLEFASEAAIAHGLVQALGAVTGPGPLTLAVDDAQWLDEPSVATISAALAPQARHRRPVLVLATLRSETPASGSIAKLLEAVEAVGGVVIQVGPLGPREIRTVVERELEGGRLDDALVDVLAQQAAGAPLFALEVFRSARDGGVVELRDGTWGLARGAHSLPIPISVVRLVERRVARLDGAARTVLATAAELGDTVSFEELVATGTQAAAVLDAVDAAIELGVVGAVGAGYSFNHPLYRAALRASLPPSARADVHCRILATMSGGIDPLDADSVRRAGAGTVDLVAVANHGFQAVELGRSEMIPTAVAFGIAAGDRQADLFDRPRAVATLQRALQLWHRLPAEQRASLPASHGYVRLGQALRRSGDDTAAFDAVRSAITTSRNDEERATAYAALAWLPYEHGRFSESIEIAREGLERISEPQAVATLETMLGWVLGRHGEWTDAIPILRRAVETLERGGPSPALMRALDRLGVAVSNFEPMAAVTLFERARWLAVELAQTVEQATIEMHLGAQLGDLGRFEEALAALERGRALCAVTGERYIESVIEWNAAQVAQQMGRLSEAIEHRRRELGIFREIGPNPRHQALAHAHIAHLSRLLGDPASERTESDLARATAAQSGDEGIVARVAWALATEDWFAEEPQRGNAPGTP
jgi:DNA-binding SARP family transcriptional activator/tetratricopeptide (TPR) repeat protein